MDVFRREGESRGDYMARAKTFYLHDWHASQGGPLSQEEAEEVRAPPRALLAKL